MLGAKLIILGVATTGIIGSGFAFYSFSSRKTEEIEPWQYVLVKNSIITRTSESQEENLLSSNKTTNYYCAFKQEGSFLQLQKDDKCELYKLNNLNSEDQKNIDFPRLLQSAKTTADNLYILKINRNKYVNLNKQKLIHLVKKGGSPYQDTLSNVQEITKLNFKKGKIRSNLILARISSKEHEKTLSNENKYKCQLKIQESKKDCSIYLFNSTTTSDETTIDPTKLITGTNVNNSNAEKNKLVLIEIKDNFQNEKMLRSYSPTIYKKSNNEKNPYEKVLSTQYINSFTGNFTPEITKSKLLKITPEKQDYLITNNWIGNNVNAPVNDLTSEKIKNYQCKFKFDKKIIIDNTCTINSVTTKTDNSNEIDLNKINSEGTEITAKNNNLIENKFFKLSINDDELIKREFTEEDRIIIESKNELNGNNNKVYGTMNFIGRIINGNLATKINN